MSTTTFPIPSTEGVSSTEPQPISISASSSLGDPGLPPPIGHYNNWAFENILHEHFDKMRGRLMDMAECSTRDRQQARAMQALMKDAVNQAFFACRNNMENFLRDKNVITAGEGVEHGPGYGLKAQSIADFFYEGN